MESYYTYVVRRGSEVPDAPRVACLDSRFADTVLTRRFGGDKLLRETSDAACLADVRSGRADIACIRQEAAQYQTMRGDFPDLVSTGVVVYRKNVAMGVSQQADPALLHLLDKEIRYMGPDVTEAYFVQQTQRAINDWSVFSYFYNYPLQIFGGVLAVFLLGAAAFWRYRRQRRRNEQRLQGIEREITVAVMGCVVNGPGEAHEADYGIAGGKDCGLLFRRGEILGKYPADKLADALVDLILSEK